MHGLPQLVNDGKHLFSSLTRIILIFAAIVCLGQLLATDALFRKTKSDEPINSTIVATMGCPGFAMVFFSLIVFFWVVSKPPYLHPYNLDHWGLIGFETSVFIMVIIRGESQNIIHSKPYLFAVFLGAMPFVYLASCLVFGSSYEGLSVKVLGAVCFVCLVVLGFQKAIL